MPLKFPDDFDLELVNTYCDEYRRKREIKRPITLFDVLALSKLGKRTATGFAPNLACAILFARDPTEVIPGAFIRVIRYDGEEENFGKKLNSVFDRWTSGPLPKQILEAERMIDTQMRSFTRLGADGRFQTRAEYPKDVWFEALINATVHRSYNLKNMNIFVKLYENKISFESPGTFFPPTTAETVYDAHNPRNPNLMWGLFYFDFVKCAFEGTRRMREGMREADLPPPEFVQRQVGVMSVNVTLRNNVEYRKSFLNSKAGALISEKVYSELSDTEKMLINYIAEQGKTSVSQAALLLDSDWAVAKAHLTRLVSLKVLEIHGGSGKPRDARQRYILVDKRKRSAEGEK